MVSKSDKIRHIFTANPGYKILALIITVFLWTFVMGRDDAIETKDMGIEVFLPASHELLLVQPTRVQVTLKGTPKLLKRYFNNKKAIRFDIYNTDVGELRVEIKDDKLDVPYGLRVVTITPRHFDIRMKLRAGFDGKLNHKSVVTPKQIEE
jgi:YbbR domain-containing protein